MTLRRTAFALALLISGTFVTALTAEEAKTLPMINGEVTKIDEAAGKITIKHDAITNLDMGAMTMVFKASDPAMLAAVKPGEKIKFSADKVNGQITVTKIEKSK